MRLHRGSELVHEWRVAYGEAACGWAGSVPLVIAGPDALTAELAGGPDPLVLDDSAYAHTSAVHLLVDGHGLRPEEDVDWCLLWLGRLREGRRRVFAE